VPYKEAFLPAMKVSPKGVEKKGTIVMHGGFDSFVEEFYSWMRYFSDHGFEVIAFEGPGQGAALSKYGLALDIEWEKPAKAVLDYFKLNDVTWLGISMGGWFCFRAAAFEPRIKRVVWAAPDIRVGANGSWIDVFEKKHPFHSVIIKKGILQEESAFSLKEFFSKKRVKN